MSVRPSARRVRSIVSALVFLVAGIAPSAAAQETANPHGDFAGDADCSACHTSDAWTPTREDSEFDHDDQTVFPITGVHLDLVCEGCHLGLRFAEPKLTGAECATCHVDVHSGSLGPDCTACHTTDSFMTAEAGDPHVRSMFPLTGAHQVITCQSCHVDDVGGDFGPLDAECISCHQDDYEFATFVDHVAGGFSTQCTDCHSTVAWRQAPVFDHPTAANGYELVEAHASLACESCHLRPGPGTLFAPMDQNDCIACHQGDYDKEHAGSGFATTCLDCHNQTNWDAAFDHAQTGFALVGAHNSLGCESCHSPVDNALLFPTPGNQDDCIACHQDEYDRQHMGSGFPVTCLDCHTVDTWSGASFDHNQTAFSLVGAHTSLACQGCHNPADNSLLEQTPAGQNDCVACHQDDYDAQHLGSGLPTTCVDCHSVNTWTGATLDHDAQFFPIFSGKHQPQWQTCEDCHTSPGNFAVFTCFTCHKHNQNDTDNQHQNVSGYAYESAACLSCHPQGLE